ncbi:hypothetical protein UlMin_006253 [Ulmus minor]
MAIKLFFFSATVAVLLAALNLFNNNPSSFPSHQHHFEFVPIVGAIGPESFAFDNLGQGPYTGISDGRIIKWQENQRRWIDFAATTSNRSGCEGPHDHHQTEHICGRPLGLKFNKSNGDLYIADAYMGLQVVGSEGGLATKVVSEAQGIPLGFTNALDIDQRTGSLYFTDSSSLYQRRNYISVILSGDKTGRLMRYKPKSKQVEVLLGNLSFPNGVALSQNGDFLVLAETTSCRIIRYWLQTPRAGTFEVFAQLPGFPDNIKRSEKGGFWVGINSRRKLIFKWVLSYPIIGRTILKLPIDVMKVYKCFANWTGSKGLILRLSEEGEVLDLVEDRSGLRWKSVSEVEERDGSLWIGSIDRPFAGKYKIIQNV